MPSEGADPEIYPDISLQDLALMEVPAQIPSNLNESVNEHGIGDFFDSFIHNYTISFFNTVSI